MNEVILYALVDLTGRIYYTGSIMDQVEEFKKALGNETLQIIELKGEIQNG